MSDLADTVRLASSVNIQQRCSFHSCLISEAPFPQATFDAVTCISVLEHIPSDREAIEKMWGLLKNGGRLFITVPCSANATEEFLDKDEYGLLGADVNGYFFFQRTYDSELLRQKIFAYTGQPQRSAIYGEKVAGSYYRNQKQKRSDPDYPGWREPYMMGEQYAFYDRIEDLPGIGVIAMEFVKTAPSN